MQEDSRTADIRFQPDENPPPMLSVGLGLQLALLSIAGIVLTPAIVVRSAGAGEQFLQWAVFSAVIVSGTTTIVQAVRVWRVGAGYVLLMGSSGAFIAACIAALSSGGPPLLATLIVISALFQFLPGQSAAAVQADPYAHGFGHGNHAHFRNRDAGDL